MAHPRYIAFEKTNTENGETLYVVYNATDEKHAGEASKRPDLKWEKAPEAFTTVGFDKSEVKEIIL